MKVNEDLYSDQNSIDDKILKYTVSRRNKIKLTILSVELSFTVKKIK